MSPEARFLINTAVMLVGGIGIPVAVCAFAWLKGRLPERLGASLYCFSALVSLAAVFLTGQKVPVGPELAFDTLVALGFLYLALRYNNMWLGSAMILKGLQLSLHATHLTEGADPILGGVNLYAAGLNLVGLAIAVTITGGVVSSARQRRRAASPPAPPPSSAHNGFAH